MTKIDLAIQGVPIRTPLAKAARRNAKIWLCLWLMAADAVALAFGFAVALVVEEPRTISDGLWTAMAGALFVHAAIAFQNQAYNPRCLTKPSKSCRQALLSFATTLLVFLLVAFSLKVTGKVPRFALGMGMVTALTLLLSQRLLICHVVSKTFGKLTAELVIVDGANVPDGYLNREIVDARASGLRTDLDDPYMLDRLGTVLQDYDRVVIVCTPDHKAEWARALKGVNIVGEIVMPEIAELGPLTTRQRDGVTTVVVSWGPLNRANRVKKRALDLAVTIPALLMLLPVLVMVAIAIKLDSPGPVFFRQERMGRGNRIFQILKFRSMRVETSDATGARSASRDDDRITRVGRLIRMTSIDELPQLINVLFGEMSLVGPRPHALGSTAGDELFWRVDRQYWHRHALKPGITGLAQIRGFRGATNTKRDILNRLEADLEYQHGWSLVRDISILVRTAQVLMHHNAY
ncbi:exopolysaccharide biosynthesis polyprenyl glycosylphosphotransferase [Sphingomonas kyeonggiensis]|uniref:exopolysaccharide biosynthesis polyprenyl glycosylphosphotransferase n=1 Tax=Sphingomonas kyeonggiensis TaxID=1268553 RepID=UPI002782FCC1|nr:exopolysaccharide biosynthesis polyprenyl glycosylphosphotransferase [Sphingomonas kyeonggiensis]MDQ0251551.1 exopolysaccharide biosynthesis polyprenyl glycosylphosphotransferase [Sphingomonas kyeonggiensis]